MVCPDRSRRLWVRRVRRQAEQLRRCYSIEFRRSQTSTWARGVQVGEVEVSTSSRTIIVVVSYVRVVLGLAALTMGSALTVFGAPNAMWLVWICFAAWTLHVWRPLYVERRGTGAVLGTVGPASGKPIHSSEMCWLRYRRSLGQLMGTAMLQAGVGESCEPCWIRGFRGAVLWKDAALPLVSARDCGIHFAHTRRALALVERLCGHSIDLSSATVTKAGRQGL